MIPAFTTVIGVDAGRLEHLRLTFPTWVKYKPEIMANPLIVFYDDASIAGPGPLLQILKSHSSVTCVSWPPFGTVYDGIPGDRWGDPQRAKMLSGFNYVASLCVQTPYWLKLDVDAVATSLEPWINPTWFDNEPVLIAPSWGYSKPPTVMTNLDAWVAKNANHLPELAATKPLNLYVAAGSNLVRHKRIISWVALFNTKFIETITQWCAKTCGEGKLPQPTQDGVTFYVAERLGCAMIKTREIAHGWLHLRNIRGIQNAINPK